MCIGLDLVFYWLNCIDRPPGGAPDAISTYMAKNHSIKSRSKIVFSEPTCNIIIEI